MTFFITALTALTALTIVIVDRAIVRHYESELKVMLDAVDRRGRNDMDRFHSKHGCDGTCEHPV